MEIFQHGEFIQNSVKNFVLLLTLKILNALFLYAFVIFAAIIRSVFPLIASCASVFAQHSVGPDFFSEHIIPLSLFKS